MEKRATKQLEHLDAPSNQNIDRLLTKLDTIFGQITDASTAGEIAVHTAERDGVFRELGEKFNFPQTPEPLSAEAKLVDYLCAAKVFRRN